MVNLEQSAYFIQNKAPQNHLSQPRSLNKVMGMSIDIHVYDVEKLKKVLDTSIKISKDQMKPSELLEKVMTESGIVRNGLFIVQSADYWEDYDPSSAVQILFERYYHIESVYELFDKSQLDWIYDGCDAESLADAAGIEDLPVHPYDEEDE